MVIGFGLVVDCVVDVSTGSWIVGGVCVVDSCTGNCDDGIVYFFLTCQHPNGSRFDDLTLIWWD